MVSQDRFLEGLFAPHGGLVLKPDASTVPPSQLARVIRSLAQSIFGAREARQSDFALVGPGKC